MTRRSIAYRSATWRVLYVDHAGARRVSTLETPSDANALVADLAGQGITAKVKAASAAWRARFRDETGKEHSKHFLRKRDAQSWLDEQTTATATGTYVAPKAGRVSFQDYAESWRASQVFRPRTVDLVERALRVRVYPLIGKQSLETLQKSTIQRLVASLDRRYAPRTVVVTYSYVSTILKDAVENRRIARTPCVGIKLPEIVQTRVRPRPTEQVRQAAEAVGARLAAAVWLASGTGLRQGEVLGLTVDRVRFLERRIIIDRQLTDVRRGGIPVFGPPKTRASVREVPLPEFVAEALSRHLERFPVGPDNLVFTTFRGNPWRRKTFYDEWRERLNAAGLKGFDFHELRHYYASLLIDSGASVKVVQARLGHKSAEETLNTYAHLWPDSDDRTRDAIDKALRAASAESSADFADSLRTPNQNPQHFP